MTHSSLAPVFAGLRFSLHFLLVGLTVFACLRGFVLDDPAAGPTLLVGCVFVAFYVLGAALVRRSGGGAAAQRGLAAWWVVLLSLLWAVLVSLSPEAAYLVFPLFFLYLHLLHGWRGYAAICVATIVAILALGWHQGFSAGGVVGPLIGAGVAVLIGLGYRALMREAQERERLLKDLLATRERLAASEREQGALAERARLAREIHDTVAQGLSSIQMLVRAAERTSEEPASQHLALARETAATSLAETRQIIRELTPARLDDGLVAALRRLGAEVAARDGVDVQVDAREMDLAMDVQTALLRITQGALSNVVRHASASRASVSLRSLGDAAELVVMDDGVGFDPRTALAAAPGRDSFGIRAMRERAEQLGGTLGIESSPGAGTSVVVRLPLTPLGGAA